MSNLEKLECSFEKHKQMFDYISKDTIDYKFLGSYTIICKDNILWIGISELDESYTLKFDRDLEYVSVSNWKEVKRKIKEGDFKLLKKVYDLVKISNEKTWKEVWEVAEKIKEVVEYTGNDKELMYYLGEFIISYLSSHKSDEINIEDFYLDFINNFLSNEREIKFGSAAWATFAAKLNYDKIISWIKIRLKELK